jgi:hypothetical protein
MITIRPGPNMGADLAGLPSSIILFHRFRRGNLLESISRLVRISPNICLYLGVRVTSWFNNTPLTARYLREAPHWIFGIEEHRTGRRLQVYNP